MRSVTLKISLYTIVIFIFILTGYCELEMQSQLSVIYVADTQDLIFSLKDRVTNGSIAITPTKTVQNQTVGARDPEDASGTTARRKEINDKRGNHDEDGKSDESMTFWDKPIVPLINTYYYYDQAVVELLLNFTRNPDKAKRLTKDHLTLIRKYIHEWIQYITVPPVKENLRTRQIFGHYYQIPSAIKFQDLNLRMIIRTQVELQMILSLSHDPVWQEEVVEKAEEAEAVTGYNSLDENRLKGAGYSLAILGKTYNLHPFEIFYIRNKDIPISDLITAAFYMFDHKHYSVALQWIQATMNLISEQYNSVWTNIREQNERLSHFYPASELYHNKFRSFREEFERNRENTVNAELEYNNNILEQLKKETTDMNERKEFRKQTYKLYLGLFHHSAAAYHDEHLTAPDYENYVGQFPKPIRQMSVLEQSSKEAKEIHLRTYQARTMRQDIYAKHEKLCRGIETKSLKNMSGGYHCRLDSRNSPWLFLMPVKMEELNRDPEVLIFHHVISEKMIEDLQQLHFPLAFEAVTTNAVISEINSVVRQSFVGWMPDTLYKHVQTTSLIAAHSTGLYAKDSELSGAEPLQVNSYGSAGFYTPHEDAFDAFQQVDIEDKESMKNFTKTFPHGDRVATFMIYLSDEPAGGRTVFPLLGLSVTPEKGSAIYWKNLHRNGTLNKLSIHAGCPVLAGTKWVANKWFLSNVLMFTEPCSLEKSQ